MCQISLACVGKHTISREEKAHEYAPDVECLKSHDMNTWLHLDVTKETFTIDDKILWRTNIMLLYLLI